MRVGPNANGDVEGRDDTENEKNMDGDAVETIRCDVERVRRVTERAAAHGGYRDDIFEKSIDDAAFAADGVREGEGGFWGQIHA